MSKVHFIDADSIEKIKQGYYDAVRNHCTHYMAHGSKGYYGWNIFTNEHIPIAGDGSECQEICYDTTPIIISISEIDRVSVSAEISRENVSLLKTVDINVLAKETMLKEKIEMLESFNAALKLKNTNLKREIDEMQSNANRPLSVHELLTKKVDLPEGVTLEIEIKK